MGFVCCVRGCGNKPKKWSGVKFHTVPSKDPERMRKWLAALNIEPEAAGETPKLFVCSDHFCPEDYGRRVEFRSGGKMLNLVLKDTAVPSVGITVRPSLIPPCPPPASTLVWINKLID